MEIVEVLKNKDFEFPRAHSYNRRRDYGQQESKFFRFLLPVFWILDLSISPYSFVFDYL